MNGTLPHWLARLLGLPDGEGASGVVGRLENRWNWAPWVTLLFLIFCGTLVLWAYWTESGTARRWLRTVLATVRFVLIGLVLLMIAEWILVRDRTDAPYLVVVLDRSASMATVDGPSKGDSQITGDRPDNSTARNQLLSQLTAAGLDSPSRINLAKSLLLNNQGELLRTIAKQFQLKVYFLADSALPQTGTPAELQTLIRDVTADGSQTRLGDGLRKILDDLRGAPPSAIILFTDGINTAGESLAEATSLAKRKGVPLYTIGLGSEDPVRDLELSDLLVDEVAFVDDILNFEFKLTASGYEGRNVEIVLREGPNGEVLTRKTVAAGKDRVSQKVRLAYRPKKVGEFEYVVEVQPLADEANPDNNRVRRVVSVRKEQIRVLLVQAYPNYEFRYLKHLLQRDPIGIDVKTVLQDADVEYTEVDKTALRTFPVRRDDLFAYDVIVFGDVNPAYLSSAVQTNLVDFVREKGGGIVFVAGPKYNPTAYRGTLLGPLFPVELDGVKPMSADVKQGYTIAPTELGLTSPTLQLGDSPGETAQIWPKLPEMFGLCETPHLKPGTQVLAEHPTLLGDGGQKLPIISQQYVGAGKVIFHATDDTWRWRFRVGDVFFARYWLQTIRYLSHTKLLGKDRSAELAADRREYKRGESVQLRVRFVDERLAPPGNDSVSIVVEQKGSKSHRVTLQRHATNRGVFEGVLSQPTEGSFHAWIASPTLPGAAPATDFVVVAPPGELEMLQMDATELRRAAEETKGRYYTFASASRLQDELPEPRPIPIETLPPLPLWNRWPILLLFLVLIVGEWITRKSHGMA